MLGRSHQNASAIIKSISGNKVALVIHRHPDNVAQLAVKPITPPPPIAPKPVIAPKPKPSLSVESHSSNVGDIQVGGLFNFIIHADTCLGLDGTIS